MESYFTAFNIESIKEVRPWGFYEIIFNEPQYKVKRITVHSGKKLSLQKHSKRDESWTIVNGIGNVRIGYQSSQIMDYEAKSGSHFNIPCGAIHRVENIGEEDLIFIEVQTGLYFGEDDIIRFEDDFGRECQKLEFTKNLEDSNVNFGAMPEITNGEGI